MSIITLKLFTLAVLCVAVGVNAAAQLVPHATPEFKRAQELSRTYCSVCHTYPEPDLHDLQTWRTHVFPLMCKHAGFEQSSAERQSAEEWWSVWNDFYFQAAPLAALPQGSRAPIRRDLPLFDVEDPRYRRGIGYATMVKIDPETRQICVGNALTRSLDVLDQRGRGLASLRVDSTLVQLVRQPNGWLGVQIGMVVPDDRPLGRVTRFSRSGRPFAVDCDVLTDLVRPVDCAIGDLDGDGRSDLVVCSYGNRSGVSGRLAWYKSRTDGSYAEHILMDRPGATRVFVLDYNQDGRLDIIALIAQAKEGVFLFRNDGSEQFTEIPWITQPPAWGYVSLQLVDLNGDDHLDLLTANGDLGDFECPPKRYHGVRIYLNDGRFKFCESFFYPMNGAYHALAADFDQDGDLDIAAISFFPDYDRSPQESFVYLENCGLLQFEARTFPDCERGRWLTMDSGDLDGDGDLDLVLGAAFKTPFRVPEKLKTRWEKEGPSLLILRNNLKSTAADP